MNKPKAKPGRPAVADDLKLKRRDMRVTDAEWAAWQQAATLEGSNLSAWLRSLANKAAAKVLKKSSRG